jgi:hypothetical protein
MIERDFTVGSYLAIGLRSCLSAVTSLLRFSLDMVLFLRLLKFMTDVTVKKCLTHQYR